MTHKRNINHLNKNRMCQESSHFEVCNEQHKCEYYMLESNLLHKQHTVMEKQSSQIQKAWD